MPRSGPLLTEELGLDHQTVLSVARAERSFGRAYAANGRPRAAGTLLTAAGTHYALVDAETASACLQESAHVYAGMRHPFGMVTAAASGNLDLCRALAVAPWVLRLANELTEEALDLERPRDLEDVNFVEPAPEADPIQGISGLLLLHTLLGVEGQAAPALPALFAAFDQAVPPQAPAWSGPATYATLGQVLREVAQRVVDPPSAHRLLEAFAEGQAGARQDGYHWQEMSGPPPFPVELLAVSQLLLVDSRPPNWVPRELRTALDLAMDMRLRP